MEDRIHRATEKRLEQQHGRLRLIHNRRRAHERMSSALLNAKEQQQHPQPLDKSNKSNSKQPLEERLALATARREDQFRLRVDRLVQHLTQVDLKKQKLQSIRLVQRFVRQQNHVAKSLRHFQSPAGQEELAMVSHLSLTMSKAHHSFEEAMIEMQQPNLTKLVQRMLSHCPDLQQQFSIRPKRLRTCRVFLMAFMIAAFPEDVLGEDDEGEAHEGNDGTESSSGKTLGLRQHLIDQSKRLVQVTKITISAFSKSKSRIVMWKKALLKFQAVRVAYLDAFNAWKQMDGERLSRDLIQCWTEMYSTNYWTMLSIAKYDDDGAALNDEDRVHEIIYRTKMQVDQLRQAIIRAIGLDRADEILTATKTQIEQECQIKWEEQQAQAQAENKLKQERKDKVERRQQKAASEPDLAFTRQVFSNEQLAHELIIDPSYQLKGPEASNESGLMEKLQKNMKKAFWDQIIEQVLSDGNVDRLKIEFLSVYDAILGVLGKNTKDAMEVAAQKESLVAGGSENLIQTWMDRMTFVLQMVLKNEAPARTDSTTAWLERLESAATMVTDSKVHLKLITECIPFILEKSDYLRLDSINAHLSILAPYLARNGAEHEKEKFNEKVAQNPNDALQKTRQWLEKICCDVYSKMSAVERQELHQGQSQAFMKVLKEAYLDLVQVQIEGRPDAIWPETFAMDVEHIRNLRNDIDVLTLEGSFIAILKQQFGTDRFQEKHAIELSQQLTTLFHSEQVKIPDVQVQVMAMAQRVNPQLSLEIKTSLEKQIQQVMEEGKSHPVFRLIFQRIVKFFGHQTMIDASSSVPTGLEVFEKELGEVCRKGGKLFRHNQAVHAQHYNGIIQNYLNTMTSVLD